MATNKNALIRYKTLDRCFRNPGRLYTLDDLNDECNRSIRELNPKSNGIKRRQLQNDIKDMESIFDIELAKLPPKGRQKVFRYSNLNFSIFNQKINETDANELKAAIMALSQMQYEWADELSVRLKEEFKMVDDPRKIIEFEENEYLEGKEYISELYNAIFYKKVLKIVYHSFNSLEPKIFHLHPYYLRQFNNRWFLFGQDEKYDSLSNLPLDRIKSIKETNKLYIDHDINFKDYFEDVVGVTVPDVETVKVVLKISANTYNYIRTKPLHESQPKNPVEQNEEFVILPIKVKPNFELESRLLSFGENIEILEPKELREKLKTRVALTFLKYEK